MNLSAHRIEHRLHLALVCAFAVGAAVMGGSAVAANNATATATTTVVTPISITKVADLSFGNIAGSATAGTITVNTNGGTPAVTGGAIATGGTVSAAKFDIVGSGSMTYSISYATGVTLTTGGGGAPMALTQISDLTGAGGASGLVTSGTLNSGAQSLFIGGTLAVGIDQAAGTYTGSISATVAYN